MKGVIAPNPHEVYRIITPELSSNIQKVRAELGVEFFPARHRDLSSPYLVNIVAYSPCAVQGDRKSTRLNSSHVAISYAVFCLKKNKKIGKEHGLIAQLQGVSAKDDEIAQP